MAQRHASDSKVLINGLGRSGTSWVMKVFDHHPWVFASHEPENQDPEQNFRVYESDQVDVAKQVDRLFTARPLRSMRKRPILTKGYRSIPAHLARCAYIYGASAVDMLTAKFESPIAVPDLADLEGATMVVKTVSLVRFVEQMARATPNLKIIFLIRHPCGYAASMEKGISSGKMSEIFLPQPALIENLKNYDASLAPNRSEKVSLLETLAYRWAVDNDSTVRSAAHLPNLKVVRYEDLCADPMKAFQSLLEWVGLDWDERCARFVAASLTTNQDSNEYHGLIRNPERAANRWKTTMSPENQRTVMTIAAQSAAADLYEFSST